MPDLTHPLDILIKKRDGHELTTAEMRAFIQAVTRNHAPSLPPLVPTDPQFLTDAQTAAFLMAVFLNGLSPRELADLTQAMRFSGDTLHAPPNTFTVDKHSTGGVGDKTSLLIAPILAAASATSPQLIAVPMISGRSLGHTGGTLDKLETIPGFNTQLPLDRIPALLEQIHAVLVGQTPTLVPADRVLYALRDHTGTVESPFLITASIMSKKLAEDLRGLVLDVKVGSGAFMPTYAASKQLAELMVSTGTHAGTRTVALLTSMDQPLGRFAGNWLEVQECVDILQNRRHPLSADLIELSNTLSGHMLHLAGHTPTPEAGAALADELLRNGAAYNAWLRIVEAQGGDTSVFQNPVAFHQPKATHTLTAPHAGYLAAMDCKQVGWAVQRLGAGRARPGDPVSAHAGIEMHAKLGDPVQLNQPLITLYAEDAPLLQEPLRMLTETLHITPEKPEVSPLVHEVMTA
jgi:pyrimidine-nucleoside phosphorylase